MMNTEESTRARFVCAAGIVLAVVLVSQTVWAGNIYSLDMRHMSEAPGGYPVQITVNVYEGNSVDPDKLEGTSSAMFDGGSLSDLACDAVACISEASLAGGELVLTYVVDGWDNGEFKNETTFEVIVAGSSSTLTLHTSCSRIIYVERPYHGDPTGTFFIEDGTGDCFIGPDDCPPGNDLFWLVGEFRMPCLQPGPITFNVYRNDDDLKATATAVFNGGGLVDIVNGFAAILDDAHVDGDDLVVSFTSYGYKDGGDYDSNSRFEMVTPCGTYYLDQHTSCSDPIYLNVPQPAVPYGNVTYTDACGGCIETGEYPEDCPYDDKLYWIAGGFRVPCNGSAELTFTVHNNDEWDNARGTATAHWDGATLTNITNDLVALIEFAYVDGGELVVGFEAFGFDNDHFKTRTSLSLDVSGCGIFRLVDYHTSCSQPIELDVPFPMEPSGTTTFTDFCGCEESVVSTEIRSWTDVKSLFR